MINKLKWCCQISIILSSKKKPKKTTTQKSDGDCPCTYQRYYCVWIIEWMHCEELWITEYKSLWKESGHLHCCCPACVHSQWSTAHAEIKVPFVENPELTNYCYPFKAWSRSEYSHTFCPRQKCFPCPYFDLFHSPSFSPNPLPTFELY